MFEIINELVEAIKKDDIYKSYIKANDNLNDAKTLALLSRHQNLMEDYYRLRQYESYTSLDQIKKDIKDVNDDIQKNDQIMNYYNYYYQLNDLLEEVTHIVFNDISDELNLTRFEL
ncbi:MAG: YlbF family regulator [Erysipelotrichaceae bacterium]|nr:YlbF family regulator [Erysipelotrichaceae bacterium]